MSQLDHLAIHTVAHLEVYVWGRGWEFLDQYKNAAEVMNNILCSQHWFIPCGGSAYGKAKPGVQVKPILANNLLKWVEDIVKNNSNKDCDVM